MTEPFIERDALANTPEQPARKDHHTHTHAPLKSFLATPRQDPTLLERFRSLWKSELKPGQYIVRKDGLRYMFIITSNSYLDRDDETITSKALESYEASCYPGADLFHCDNPLLWWHDDAVPMGEIVAVNYSTPFLIEVARELPDPVSKILWDYAETNGDNAGASHRFGYREEDRQADGSYTHIVKQETSYLPERLLAANIGTYAGVLKDMSTAQSDTRLNAIFNQATGGAIKDAASKIHAKTGALAKELAALGINHKAKAEGDPTEPELDEDGNPIPEDEKVEVTLPDDFMAKLQQLNAIYQMMMDMMTAQGGMVEDLDTAVEAEVELAKAFKAFRDERTKEKAHTATLEQRIAVLEARAKMAPRKASTDPETNITAAELKALQEQAEKANTTTHPAFGVSIDPSKSPFKRQ